MGLNKCPMCRATYIEIANNDNSEIANNDNSEIANNDNSEIDNEFNHFMDNYYSNLESTYKNAHLSRRAFKQYDLDSTQQNKNNWKTIKSQMRQQKSFGKRQQKSFGKR
jgi:hypothetical protein